MSISLIILILITHFIADFMFQTHEQAINKSKSIWFLTQHVGSYTFGLLVFSVMITVMHIQPMHRYMLAWVALNAGLHWITDFFTSKLNARLWKDQQWHWFFVGIGIDQLIHYICLFGLYEYLIINHSPF